MICAVADCVRACAVVVADFGDETTGGSNTSLVVAGVLSLVFGCVALREYWIDHRKSKVSHAEWRKLAIMTSQNAAIGKAMEGVEVAEKKAASQLQKAFQNPMRDDHGEVDTKNDEDADGRND